MTGSEDVRTQLDDWVAAGVLDPVQASRILEYEQAKAGQPAPRPARRPFLAEALGYVGATLALGAAVAAVATFWDDLETWARVTLVGTVTLLLVMGGALVPAGEAPLRRLGSTLWALASGGVAALAAIVATDVLDLDDQNVLLVTGAASFAVTALLWQRRPLPLQLLVTMAASVVAVCGIVAQYDHAYGSELGPAIAGLGLVWLALTWGGLVRPAGTASWAAGLVTLAGAFVFAVEVGTAGILTGLALALVLVGWGLATRGRGLIAAGALGTLVFVPYLVAHLSEGRRPDETGGTIAWVLLLFVAGAALVAGAVALSRRTPGGTRVR
jgi:hypothetical protein